MHTCSRVILFFFMAFIHLICMHTTMQTHTTWASSSWLTNFRWVYTHAFHINISCVTCVIHSSASQNLLLELNKHTHTNTHTNPCHAPTIMRHITQYRWRFPRNQSTCSPSSVLVLYISQHVRVGLFWYYTSVNMFAFLCFGTIYKTTCSRWSVLVLYITRHVCARLFWYYI